MTHDTDCEWGIFNDEGLVEGGFWTHAEATTRAATYDADDGVEVCAICHEHEGQRADACDDCDEETE